MAKQLQKLALCANKLRIIALTAEKQENPMCPIHLCGTHEISFQLFTPFQQPTLLYSV